MNLEILAARFWNTINCKLGIWDPCDCQDWLEKLCSSVHGAISSFKIAPRFIIIPTKKLLYMCNKYMPFQKHTLQVLFASSIIF